MDFDETDDSDVRPRTEDDHVCRYCTTGGSLCESSGSGYRMCYCENPTTVKSPTCSPTGSPTLVPSESPTQSPTSSPTESPTSPTAVPIVVTKADKKRGKKGNDAKTKVPKADGKKTIVKTKTPVPDKGVKGNKKGAVVPKHTKVPKAPQAGQAKGAKRGKEMDE